MSNLFVLYSSRISKIPHTELEQLQSVASYKLRGELSQPTVKRNLSQPDSLETGGVQFPFAAYQISFQN